MISALSGVWALCALRQVLRIKISGGEVGLHAALDAIDNDGTGELSLQEFR